MTTAINRKLFLFWGIGLLGLLGGLLSITATAEAQNITPATGGENISADDVNGAYTALTDIVIDETSPGQVSLGDIILTLPNGFEWDQNITPTLSITGATGYNGNGTKLDVEFSHFDSNRKMVFSVIATSEQSSNKAGMLTISGMAVRPTTAELPNGGEIITEGSSIPNVNNSFGTLQMEAGTPNEIFIESAPDGSGEIIENRDVIAGNSLTLYAISRDQGGNFIENIAADDWSINKTDLTDSPLGVTPDSRSAVFSSELVGTATVTASYGSLETHSTGTISVIPGAPTALDMQTQPSTENTAGEVFPTPPSVALVDQYGNIITSNNFKTVTAQRVNGVGNLQGTTAVTASNGIASFPAIYHTVANDISLRFSASAVTSTSSNTINIAPAPAQKLSFLTQPPNGATNNALDPAPRVQLLDAYENHVPESGVTVSIEKVSGSGKLNGTNSVTTNGSGTAVFDNLTINQTGTYTIRAINDNLEASEPSDAFTIANTGTLAGFKITTTAGDSIPTQTAGEPFDIRIAAVDGTGKLLDGQQGRDHFTGSVDLSTTNTFSANTDITGIGPFVDGVYASHQLEFTGAGSSTRIKATHTEGNESGSSNPFTVSASEAFPDSAELIVPQTTLTANGSDTTNITVQLYDSYGNPLTSGGDQVSVNGEGTGSISTVTDNGDGSYTAVLTAPVNVGSATVTMDINGSAVSSVSETIDFIPGPLATFLIENAGGSSGVISEQTAGTPFDVRITAKDIHNNTVPTYAGKVELTSSAVISNGGGTTASFEDGVLNSHTITLTSAGTYKLKARNSGHQEAGESNAFTVTPSAASLLTTSLTADKSYLENNTSSTTSIKAQLRDEYGNPLSSEGDYSVSLSFVNPADASLSSGGNTIYEGDGIFSGQLTASTSVETVTITASLSGGGQSGNFDEVEIVITQFNNWTSNESGGRASNRDWGDGSNWSLTTTPTTGQIIQVPTDAPFFPTIEQNSSIDFLNIAQGATVNLEPNYTMDINQDLTGEGTYICDRSTVNIYGNLTVATYASRTCDTIFTGSGEGEISGNAIMGNVTIDRDMTLTGSLESVESLTVTEDNTLTVEEGGTLDIQGEIQIDGELVFNGGHLEIGTDIDDSNINISNTTVEYNGTEPQDITGMDDFDDLIINNPDGVTFHNDVVVDGTLVLEEGMITIDSGYSLVTDDQSGNLGNIRMLRDITGEPGWRMITSPLQSNYENLLGATLTQGYDGSQLGLDSNGNPLQPNVLYYDITYEGTDNQRWRAPGTASDALSAGRGLFVYFFGEIPEDDRYNDPLPYELSVTGAENTGNENAFNFDVHYPTGMDPEESDVSEADMGFNMVGNPFAATIDWGDGNWTKEYMDDVIYVWDPAEKDYLTWNGVDGSLGSGLITPFQAFWVRANGQGEPKLAVNYDSKTTGGTFKRKENKKPASIEFLLETNSLQKKTHITLSNDGKTGKDLRDAYRLLPFDTNTYLEFYTALENGQQLVINNLPREFGKEVSIPLYVGGYHKGKVENGEYTLSWPSFGNVPEAWSIILVDQKNGKKVDLRKNTFYSFDVAQNKQKKTTAPERPGMQLTERVPLKAKSSGDGPRFLVKINPGADAEGLPEEYSLDLTYPNPFRNNTTIEFATPLEGHVELLVYDILGRKVKTLIDEDMPAAYHQFEWNPGQLASGMYICVMRAGGKQFTRKMTYIK